MSLKERLTLTARKMLIEETVERLRRLYPDATGRIRVGGTAFLYTVMKSTGYPEINFALVEKFGVTLDDYVKANKRGGLAGIIERLFNRDWSMHLIEHVCADYGEDDLVLTMTDEEGRPVEGEVHVVQNGDGPVPKPKKAPTTPIINRPAEWGTW